jgi:ligand-binding sensor domain-containing protein
MENIQKVSLLFILSLLISSFQNIQGKEHKIEFKSLPPYINIPTDVQQIYQDRDGFIWFATRNGVCRFDGYELEIIKSNLYTPGALSSNDILAIQEDYQHRLWIGTSYGLNMLDKKSGKIQKEFGALNNERVQSILITKDNTIWLGTGSSLYKSNNDPEQSNTSISFTKVRSMDVKYLVEAPNNQIWIGTWSDGLYRYITATDSLVSYPAINPLNSAYFLFQDSKEQIWIGTWGYGLYKLHHPYDQEKAYFEKFAHEEGNSNSLIHNLIYCISEDSSTGNLWIGTLEGLSCFNGKDFLNYTPNIPSNGLPYNEIISIFRDRTGTMWLGFLGGRVYWVRPQNLQFNLHQLSHASVGTACSNIQGLTVYKNDLWIGLEKHSFIIHDRTTNLIVKEKKHLILPYFNQNILIIPF